KLPLPPDRSRLGDSLRGEDRGESCSPETDLSCLPMLPPLAPCASARAGSRRAAATASAEKCRYVIALSISKRPRLPSRIARDPPPPFPQLSQTPTPAAP